MKTEVIKKTTLKDYRPLILSAVYEELQQVRGNLDQDYICLAAIPDDGTEPVSVLIAQTEETGDLNLVSLYTIPEYQQQGCASYLLDQLCMVARRLFLWEEGETEYSILIKTVYRLPEHAEAVYDAFLKKNHFTDFYLLDEDEEYKVWGAVAEVRFYRNSDTERADAAAPDETETEGKM
ncbi:MAG: hypothetical protein K6C06_06185 [Lachnospiraceae bacterium]|nr:hypothetical protein [Lachnospiraceae bacterium]